MHDPLEGGQSVSFKISCSQLYLRTVAQCFLHSIDFCLRWAGYILSKSDLFSDWKVCDASQFSSLHLSGSCLLTWVIMSQQSKQHIHVQQALDESCFTDDSLTSVKRESHDVNQFSCDCCCCEGWHRQNLDAACAFRIILDNRRMLTTSRQKCLMHKTLFCHHLPVLKCVRFVVDGFGGHNNLK